MSINVNPEESAKLVAASSPARSDDTEDIVEESLVLYASAYRLAEKYVNIITNCYDTAEILKETNEINLQLK